MNYTLLTNNKEELTVEAVHEARCHEMGAALCRIFPSIESYRVTSDNHLVLKTWMGQYSHRLQVGDKPAVMNHNLYVNGERVSLDDPSTMFPLEDEDVR